eukprot:5110753-Pyramimonas_sp.AAC.1
MAASSWTEMSLSQNGYGKPSRASWTDHSVTRGPLGPSEIHLGALWASLGAVLGHSGALLGRSRPSLPARPNIKTDPISILVLSAIVRLYVC